MGVGVICAGKRFLTGSLWQPIETVKPDPIRCYRRCKGIRERRQIGVQLKVSRLYCGIALDSEKVRRADTHDDIGCREIREQYSVCPAGWGAERADPDFGQG